MEVRLDMDPVPSADGGLVGASHGATYECGSAAYTAAMYSVSMDREAADGDMTAAEALTAMAANLASVPGSERWKAPVSGAVPVL